MGVARGAFEDGRWRHYCPLIGPDDAEMTAERTLLEYAVSLYIVVVLRRKQANALDHTGEKHGRHQS
jgi:hypothetical protein